MTDQSKQSLFVSGVALMQRFCDMNNLATPPVAVLPKSEWRFGVCAYYRPTKIKICVEACAHIGTSGRAWSYPGYTVDRTPYGAIQHELGHHVDVIHSKIVDRFRGDFSANLRKEIGGAPISGYCPDAGEWFAEIFRVFVTNPDLLRVLRPTIYNRLRQQFVPVVNAPWQLVLAGAPARTLEVCSKKVEEASRSNGLLQNTLQFTGGFVSSSDDPNGNPV